MLSFFFQIKHIIFFHFQIWKLAGGGRGQQEQPLHLKVLGRFDRWDTKNYNIFCSMFQQKLAKYDFQFSSWPVDFYWDESEDSLDRKKFEKIYDRSKKSSSFIGRVLSFPFTIARYELTGRE